MNDEILDSLLRQARAAGPRDTTALEYGFETRLRARLRPVPAPFELWLWRLAPFFAVVTLAMSWNVWEKRTDQAYTIHYELEEHAPEITYLAGLTGRGF